MNFMAASLRRTRQQYINVERAIINRPIIMLHSLHFVQLFHPFVKTHNSNVATQSVTAKTVAQRRHLQTASQVCST